MPESRTKSQSGRQALAAGDTPALRRADPVVRAWVKKMFSQRRRPAQKNRRQRTAR
jgi:hypothetical protein